jgi:hypothetical protein
LKRILSIAMLLLGGCGATPEGQSTATTAPLPVPSATVQAASPTTTTAPLPMPSATAQAALDPRQQLMLAKDKPPAQMFQGRVFHQVDDMDRVPFANMPFKDKLTTDIYYPPDANPDNKLPVVIFVNGVGDTRLPDPLKDSEQYISWGQLTAASGMIAVTYESVETYDDTLALIDFLVANADQLGIDSSRVLLWACSANLPTALRVLMNTSASYQPSLRGAVFYYGIMEGEGDLPTTVPLLVVKSGKDSAGINSTIDAFVARARSQNVPLEFVEYADGVHAFDVRQDTDETRAIVQQTLNFMTQKLLESE